MRGGLEGRGLLGFAGRYTWASGSVYDGEWKDDRRAGRGARERVPCANWCA